MRAWHVIGIGVVLTRSNEISVQLLSKLVHLIGRVIYVHILPDNIEFDEISPKEITSIFLGQTPKNIVEIIKEQNANSSGIEE